MQPPQYPFAAELADEASGRIPKHKKTILHTYHSFQGRFSICGEKERTAIHLEDVYENAKKVILFDGGSAARDTPDAAGCYA